MKKYISLVLMFLVLLCSACGSEKEPESKSTFTQIDGQTAVVTLEPGNWSAGTVQTDKGTYTFAWDRSGDLKITYPDGTSCTYWSQNMSSGISASPDFSPVSKGYIDGMSMAWGIENAIDEMRPARNSGGGNALLGLLLLAVGAFGTFAPRTAWYLSYGWRFRDAEPSDAALTIQIIGGVILLLVGFVCLLAAIF